MNKVTFFIGVDISKLHLDFCIVKGGKVLSFKRIENHTSAIKRYLHSVLALENIDYSNTVYCMEYTGIYNNHLVKILSENNAHIWLENPIHGLDP